MPNAKNVDKQVGEIGTTIVGIQANRSATSIIFLDKWHFTHLKSLSNLGKSPVVSNHHSSDVFGTGIGTILRARKLGALLRHFGPYPGDTDQCVMALQTDGPKVVA